MNCADFNKAEIDRKLREALKLLIKNDSYLLKNDVNERSITHMLAIYLKQMFDGWDVDCEYNRKHDNNIKKLLNFCPKNTSANDTDAKTVYPDIIVHRRETNNNLVVIEVKKMTNSNNSCDIEKLKAFKRDLGYCYAYYLKLRTRCKSYNTQPAEHYYKLTPIQTD